LNSESSTGAFGVWTQAGLSAALLSKLIDCKEGCMQGKAVLAWRDNLTLTSVISLGFVVLWKCSLFLDELDKYDRMSKAMRREDRRQNIR